MRESKIGSTVSVESVTNHALDILHRLGSSSSVVAKAQDLIRLAHEDGVLASCSTEGGAAGIIYIAGILEKEPVTLSAIGEAAGLHARTVRKYKSVLATKLKSKWR